MKRIGIALVAAVVLATALLAQAPVATAPVLSELDALKVAKFYTDRENLVLQIQVLEAQVRPYLQSLARPGYTLSRGQDGTWRYVAEPAPEKPAAPKK